MEDLTWSVATHCPTERFVRLTQGMLAEGRPALLVADLVETAVLLGRFQRRWSAAPDDAHAVRRPGGGRALIVGTGIAAVSLVVPRPPFSPEKTMNRCVRGLLRALSAVGGRPARYFGRDVVVAGGDEIAVLSQEGMDPVLFEAYVAVSRTLDSPPGRYPPRADPRAVRPHGKVGNVAFATLAEAVARAYDARPGPPPAEGTPPLPRVDERDEGLSWSGWAEVPIGFVEALAGEDEVRLRGDFIAPAATVAALEAELARTPRERAREVVAAAFAPVYLHGAPDASVLADAVRAAR